MMIVCVVKETQKLIEAQSYARPGTLIYNAIRSGYNKDDIEEKIVSDVEFAIIMRTPDVIAAEEAAAQRKADIEESIPSWQQVSDAIDSATTIAACKIILKKLARVVYWLAKNKGV
jgi:hypothetical protein